MATGITLEGRINHDIADAILLGEVRAKIFKLCQKSFLPKKYNSNSTVGKFQESNILDFYN